jgi:hypothetical protein
MKKTALAVILISAFLLSMLVGTVHAQIPAKPAIPEFTINIENETVVLTIENQPFDVHNSYNYSFYYDVRIISIDGNWISFYTAVDEYPTQSTSSQTILYYTIGESDYFPSVTTLDGIVIPANGQVTFQVMALIGYWETTVYSNGIISYGLKGEVSGWSNSQTITLPSTNASSPSYYVSPEGSMGTSYKLIVFSPNDQTIYDDVLHLAFILRWTYDLVPLGELKADYSYSIDDNPFVSIVPTKTSNDRYAGGTNFVYNPSFSYLLNISNLPKGYHNIVIKATFYNGKNLFLNASSTPFQFIVRTPTPTPTPTVTPAPTLTPTPVPTSTSTPMLTPEPTATPEATSQPATFPASLVFVALVGIALAVIGLFVYFKKRKRYRQ